MVKCDQCKEVPQEGGLVKRFLAGLPWSVCVPCWKSLLGALDGVTR